jgi:uncharacterized protein (TIGR03382 family)
MLDIINKIECTFPLSLFPGVASAPEYPRFTLVDLYFPSMNAFLSIPHIDNPAGITQMVDTLDNWGFRPTAQYRDDGWFFANEGRTAVKLTPDLCAMINEDRVATQVRTQVCQPCPNEGKPCQVTCAAGEENCFDGFKVGRCGAGQYACIAGDEFCAQVANPMPEICNGVDDDCDNEIDDLSENKEQWSGLQWNLKARFGGEYDGYYCRYENSCGCPNGADAFSGDASSPDEFLTYLEFHAANGTCQCGAGLETPGFSPVEEGAMGEQQAEPAAGGCSSSSQQSPAGGLLGLLLAAGLALLGRRRR